MKILLYALVILAVLGLGFWLFLGAEKTEEAQVVTPSPEPTLTPPPPTPPVSTGDCYVGGCSGQICSEEPDAVSTCEYREEYACYKSARCERQADGVCGWTTTPELLACLSANVEN